MIKKIITNLKLLYFFAKFFLPNFTLEKYINFNKLKWLKKKSTSDNKIILIDLFYWYPLIYFWSYVVNILSKNKNLSIKFFYFPTSQNKILDKLIFHKLKQIYESFNCREGVHYYQIENIQHKKFFYKKLYKRNIKNIEDLIQFKKKKIVIGDLIYDSYLRNFKKPTARSILDENLVNTFIKSNIIFDHIFLFFKKNEVKYVIPSHVVYAEYGIVARIGDYFNSKIIKVHDMAWATANFGLKVMDKKKIFTDFPYYRYAKIFKLLPFSKKKTGLKIGKRIIEQRFLGKIDNSISYMKKSSFRSNDYVKINNINIKCKKKIFLACHDLFDAVHRFKKLIFPDFFIFITETADFISKLNDIQLIIKPHPNGMQGNDFYFDNLKNKYKKFENIIFLDKSVSNLKILDIGIDLAITVHGTVAHEFAYRKIPVINAGDNPHINYNFCLHAKNKNQYFDMIKNIDKYKKNLSFNKNKIYEFMYMNYYYFLNLNNRKDLIADQMFTNNYFHKNNIISLKSGDSNSLLDFYIKNDIKVSRNICKYINNFIINNLN